MEAYLSDVLTNPHGKPHGWLGWDRCGGVVGTLGGALLRPREGLKEILLGLWEKCKGTPETSWACGG